MPRENIDKVLWLSSPRALFNDFLLMAKFYCLKNNSLQYHFVAEKHR